MDAGLKDQCVLVTGASGGIGQAIARALAAEGASLALHYRTNPDSVETLRRELNVPCLAVQADLRDERQVDGMFAAILGGFPQIHSVIANAGIWNAGAVPLHEMTLAQWHETLESDLTSVFLTCRAFLRHLGEVSRESASIVLVGSTAALFGEADHADYAAAKAGMAYGLTRSLKNEIVRLAPRGRVNCVCPAWTETPMAAGHADDPAVIRRVTSTMALQKIARPQDVAAAVVFLTSDALAGHISGAIIPVAGGMEGRLLHP